MALDLEDTETKEAFNKAVGDAVKSQLPEAVKTAVDSETAGLKAKNEELIGEKRTLQENMKKFEGLDPEKIKTMMETLDSNQDAKDLADGKIEEVFARRFEKIKLNYDGQIADLSTKLEEANGVAATSKGRADSKIIEIDLRRTAETSGVLPAAIDDVVLKGAHLFTVDDDGAILQRDPDGKIIEKDSKPITIDVWMDTVKEASPHFWPGSKGSGMDGGEGGERTSQEKQLAAFAQSGDMKSYRAMREKQRGIDTTHPRDRQENQNQNQNQNR